ncbi:MAG: PQQ-binding-like beta-propeller repeat protein, partial [Lachnospiraceae bacterium]|nr:PQQ-binding-like beta-propeller repeat protein [Lachnospiraceae bacterium]
MSLFAAAAVCIAAGLLTAAPWKERKLPAVSEAVLQTEDVLGADHTKAGGNAKNGDQEKETENPVAEAALGPEFEPHCTDATDPANLIASVEVEVNGVYYDYISDYFGEDELAFDTGEAYTDVEGIVTFRGNNFRNSPAYGHAEMTDYTLNGIWSKTTGGLTYGNATWTGSGWTGQPLMMKWPAQVKAHMNMYDWAKQEDDLVEVIYACMDGYIYFLDLKTGEETRDALYLGFTFKGSGALDPRGYPIMYVGAGYDSNEGTARVFIINLLDCSVMYTFGNNDSFSLRGSLSYFDSSALVDAETDTLIYPGENGIIYFIRLNTDYDEVAGTLSIAPDRMAKWRYQGIRSSTAAYWLGMEDSAAVYKGYLFAADNGGHLMCLNMNTMQLVWVQDILDDSNSTPVLSVEDGHLYLYISTSFHLGWRSSLTATIPIWKIDAETGEIIWQTEYECYTQDGVSGGVQSTIALGDHELSDYIYVTVAMTGTTYGGVLSCINKKTGEKEWEHEAYYAWSSPVCVYDSAGKGKVIYCSCDGQMYLLDGRTGEVNDTLALSNGAIEASPAVYEDYAV